MNSKVIAALLSAMLVFLTFSLHTMPVSSNAQIHISGITPSSAYPNETVHLYGSGATPSLIVTAILMPPANQIYIANATTPWIVLGGGNLTLGSNSSSPSGEWQIDFVTPPVFPVCYRVAVFDESSLTNDTTEFCILINAVIGPVYPSLNVTYGPGNIIFFITNTTGGPLLFYLPAFVVPSSGPAGIYVAMFGRYASGGQITVYFENTQVATVTGLPPGNWSISFQVPDVSPGNYTIRAIDVEGRWMSVASFIVTHRMVVPIVAMALSPILVIALVAFAALAGTATIMLIAIFHRKRRRRLVASAF